MDTAIAFPLLIGPLFLVWAAFVRRSPLDCIFLVVSGLAEIMLGVLLWRQTSLSTGAELGLVAGLASIGIPLFVRSFYSPLSQGHRIAMRVAGLLLFAPLIPVGMLVLVLSQGGPGPEIVP